MCKTIKVFVTSFKSLTKQKFTLFNIKKLKISQLVLRNEWFYDIGICKHELWFACPSCCRFVLWYQKPKQCQDADLRNLWFTRTWRNTGRLAGWCQRIPRFLLPLVINASRMKQCNLMQICWKNVVRGCPVRSCMQNWKVPSKGERITEHLCFPSFAQNSPHFTNKNQDIARNTLSTIKTCL